MTKPTLFVCQSCCLSEEHPEDQPADGAVLLQQVKAQLQSDAIHVQPVACLWDCDRACVVAFSAPNKPTYLFSTIQPDSAAALVEFGEHYVQSKTGNVLPQKFPELLREAAIAKIPILSRSV
jgi:predicted metal-binding protein